MRLVTFTVRNYRSITDAYKMPLGDYTVLVGPNNEGKSNILRAIGIALKMLARPMAFRGTRSRRLRSDELDMSYNWERDFPLGLREAKPTGRSEFTLEFELTDDESREFRIRTAVNLNTNLKLKLSFGKDDAILDVVLSGKAKKKFVDSLRNDVAKFVSEKVDIQYVPAIRTSAMAEQVVEEMLARELEKLEEDDGFVELLKKLEDAQKPILDSLGKELTETVSGFINEVAAVTIRTTSEYRQALRRSLEVFVDDGTDTALSLKGDGIKSLTAIALLQRISRSSSASRSLILAIEEPESHLHPRAVHALRRVIVGMSNTNQVILTTHSPVLVDRSTPSRNIVVKNGRATPAKQIQDVRHALGVEVSDNLSSASLVLLVEGQDDAIVLQSWLSEISADLRAHLSSGGLAIDTLNGASNLKYKASLHKAHVCAVHAFLDNDEAGRKAVTDAKDAGAIDDSEYHLSNCRGYANAELEDLADPAIYVSAVNGKYGVALVGKCFSGAKSQWSDRVKQCFVTQGKLWNSTTEAQVKWVVANEIGQAGLKALNPHHRAVIDGLASALQMRLSMLVGA